MTRPAGGGLLTLAAELVAVESTSHHEGPLADMVEAVVRDCAWLDVERLGDNVVARTSLGRPARLLLAGHLDTVLPAGNAAARVDGDVLWGVGSADMKGGLAVMLDLACSVPEPMVDVTWCFYACEEIDRATSGLLPLWAERPELLVADAAVLGEPTAGLVEAGCQGTLRAVVATVGVRAHTARPWTGRNAIHRLAPLLDLLAAFEGRRVVLDGCEYTEQLQAVAVGGGVAGNVVPDRASLTVNYRFAPDLTAGEAEGALRVLLGEVLTDDGDLFETVDAADGAPPSLDHPLLAALVTATGRPPRAKVGWTDVASFWAHGVPAANFGPGDPLLAHRADEHVTGVALERARAVLGSLLSADVAGGVGEMADRR